MKLFLPFGRNRKNKDGFIFTFDLTLAIIIVFIVIIIGLFFVSRASSSSVSEHQMLRIGSDLITILDEEFAFDFLDHDYIEVAMQELLPANYQMLIRIEGDFPEGNGLIEVGGSIPEKRLTLSGQKVVLNKDDLYLKITYFVWLRE